MASGVESSASHAPPPDYTASERGPLYHDMAPKKVSPSMSVSDGACRGLMLAPSISPETGVTDFLLRRRHYGAGKQH